jgi:predicted CopG family antitoxin
MASINISIKQDAYEFLKSLKSEDKSFSDVILGFKKDNDVMKYFGTLKDAKYDDSFRKSFNKRFR